MLNRPAACLSVSRVNTVSGTAVPGGHRDTLNQGVPCMLTDTQRRFLDLVRVAHLATAGRDGAPHLVPVCFCLDGRTLYITVDEKPKRADIPLKQIRNIQENPAVAVTVDRWDEDWIRLAWIMLRGSADILQR